MAISLLCFANAENYRKRLADAPSPALGRQISVALNWPALVYTLPLFMLPHRLRADIVVVLDSGRQPLFLIDVIQLMAIFVFWYWIGSKLDGYSPQWWKRRRQNCQTLLLSGHILQALLFAFIAVRVAMDAWAELRRIPTVFDVRDYVISSMLLKTLGPIIWSAVICLYSSFEARRIAKQTLCSNAHLVLK